jgi:hypothetical protein
MRTDEVMTTLEEWRKYVAVHKAGIQDDTDAAAAMFCANRAGALMEEVVSAFQASGQIDASVTVPQIVP